MSRRQPFLNIRTEGAMLPSDLLARLLEGANLPGLKPEDYHLGGGEKLNEAISRSWTRLQSLWASFQKSRSVLASTDLGTSLTREKWLLQLFQELGYGRLLAASPHRIDDKDYAISHAWQGQHYQVLAHLVSFRADLDKRSDQRIHGASKASPHSLVQEFLNRSEAHLWAFVSNGVKLRILRDNSSLTRQAYVEFDLEGIFEGEAYSDFRLLWMLCHQSRVEGTAKDRPETCWLETWSKMAHTEGRRALDQLRDGVERALTALGTGFIDHKANQVLRDRLKSGELQKDDYYRQLLRLVYRLIFLFVAEDRDLLHGPDSSAQARSRYTRFFSAQRLRRMAERSRGSGHADLWVSLRLVFAKLGDARGCPELGLPALGGFLFGAQALPDLDHAELPNEHLLLTIRHLGLVKDRSGWRLVDYRNLGSEELGSIYESLLELSPTMELDAGRFSLALVGGSERKTSGSYYTPESLIQCLLDSALEPVLARTSANPDPEKAILALKICDPACGSGHFIIAAAHRIANRLASVRTQEEAPSPESIRTALRDAIGHCVFGVDLNPMAVELCKVSLWLEALEPGKPLSFLDHHVRVGNSLLGATPEAIVAGLPDEAFAPIEGDDQSACTALRRLNRGARSGFGPLFAQQDAQTQALLQQTAAALDALPDDRPEDIQNKERALRCHEQTVEFQHKKRLADAWCAAFVIDKKICSVQREAPPYGLTQEHLNALAAGCNLDASLAEDVDVLAKSYQFFHWHLAFPEVFAKGGFDCILGNPPWERVKLQEQEFFATSRPDIVDAPNKEARATLLRNLAHEDPTLLRRWEHARRHSGAVSHFLKNCGRYPLCGGGDVNTSSVFAELGCKLIASNGRMGMVVPTAVLTDDTTKLFPQDVVRRGVLISAYDFDNSERLFPAVRPHQHFVLMTISGMAANKDCDYAFFLTNPSQLDNIDAHVTLSDEDINLLNPNTRTIPVFHNSAEAKLTKSIYRAHPLLKDDAMGEHGNPWGLSFLRMFDMASDSAAGFLLSEERIRELVPDGSDEAFRRAGYLPLFDAKMAAQYQHRAASVGMSGHQFRKISKESTNAEDLLDPSYEVTAAYWVSEREVTARLGGWTRDWLLGFKDVTGITSTRLSAFSFIPRQGVGHPFPLVSLGLATPPAYAAFTGFMNSLLVEYLLRQKMQGLHLTYFLVKQLPAPTPVALNASCKWDLSTSIADWLCRRVAELSCTSYSLDGLAQDFVGVACAYRWDEERRLIMRAEIDAAIFHLFNLSDDDVRFVLGALEKVARKDQTVWGRPRTEEETCRAFRALADAIRSGNPYQSPLNPPPADPRCCHPARPTVGK